MSKQFNTTGMGIPKSLNPDTMAKAFMSLTAERYPSSDKVKALAKTLGIEDNVIAQIIIFSQFRDAVRGVAMNQIFRNVQHRDELFVAIIDALEDLEEELEEMQEEEEQEEAWEEEDEGEEEEIKTDKKIDQGG